jgi:two-component system, LytTR family, response regulator
MSALDAVLIDDEAPARALLRDLLGEHPEVRVVGEAGSVAEAAELVRRLRPGIIFLDIRLGRSNGFELLTQLPQPPPRVVFVTAYGQYAVRAFDNEAVDYLLKPLDPARLKRTVERLCAVPGGTPAPDMGALLATLQSLAGALPNAPAPAAAVAPARPRFVARVDDRFVVVDVSQVQVIEADKNYVWFCTAEGRVRARYTINDVEASIDPGEFLRLNRSTIVRAAQIEGFERNFRGRLLVILKSGRRIVCTSGYRERVFRYLGV